MGHEYGRTDAEDFKAQLEQCERDGQQMCEELGRLRETNADLLAACKSIAKDGADWLSEEASSMLRAAIAKATP